MPQVIDYPLVLRQMMAAGFRCHYYNSGAFGFGDQPGVRIVGWLGPEDPTIRPEVLPLTKHVPPPYEQSLTDMLLATWQSHLPGPLWAMPRSHWAHELHHGSRDWMPALLQRLGVDPESLAARTDAAAIEFAVEESELLRTFSLHLLQQLEGSDFTIAFPGRPVLCILHHHQQLWWMTADAGLTQRIETAQV